VPSRGILRALGFFIFHAAALAHVPCFSGLLVCPQLYGFGAGEALAALVLLPNVHVRSRKACNSVRSWSLRSCLGKVWKHFYNLRLRLTWGPSAIAADLWAWGWVHGHLPGWGSLWHCGWEGRASLSTPCSPMGLAQPPAVSTSLGQTT